MPRARAAKAAGEMCAEHFPGGFPAWAIELGCEEVTCEHGHYTRTETPAPAAEPEGSGDEDAE